MQAFRMATTVDEQGELHVANIPFSPGTAVEVIVLEQGKQVDELARSGTEARSHVVKTAEGSSDPPTHRPRERMHLADEQYRLARQYPDEYVVLVGERIVHHSPNRQQAARAYDRAALDSPSSRPVIVRPGGGPRKPPVVRGRALTGKLGAMK